MTNTKKYLSPAPFSSLTNWSVQYLLDNDFNYTDKYPFVKIGSFLSRSKTPINVENGKEYKRVTIRINNGGVLLRDIEKGENIGTKKQCLVKEGQFIFSRIDARNGAFGVIPKELNGAIVTNDFPAFNVETSVINIEYLVLITTTKEFVKYAQASSSGTTNRQRINVDVFLDQSIPLPSLKEQNKIVEAYNRKIQLAEQQNKQASDLEKEIEDYLFEELDIEKKEEEIKAKGLKLLAFSKLNIWGVRNKANILESAKYDNVLLSKVACINPQTDLKGLSPDLEMSFIPMECISDSYGEIIEKRKGKKELTKGYTKFQDDDLIWARITPCMQNGKSAVVRNLTNGFGYGSTEYHVIRRNSSSVNVDYIYSLLRLKSTLLNAQSYFTGSAGQQRVPKSYLENLEIPLPPLPKQNEIVEHITSLKAAIKLLHQQAEQNCQQAIRDFENTIFS